MDAYGHVNNVVYIKWLEQCAWAHSAAVGFSQERCVAMARGMVVRTLNVNYLSACYAGDEIAVGNWISANDGKLRVTRRFQLMNTASLRTVMRGEVIFVCVNLDNGRPVRLPAEFIDAYAANAVAT